MTEPLISALWFCFCNGSVEYSPQLQQREFVLNTENLDQVFADGKIDDLARQTQAGFDDHRLYAEFLNQGIREEMNTRFNRMERRFDSVDNRFDRLEQLIKER